MEHLIIRNEMVDERRNVETVLREAFWNQYVPGCDEHYLAHIMRSHPDFVPELDLVAELDGQVVGAVLYTKSRLVDDAGAEKQILTFGPIGVLPAYQRRGISRALLEASFDRASALGYEVIVIFGNPGNYVSRGFRSCKKYNVCLEPGVFPTAMLVKELSPGALDGRRWVYHESPVCEIDPAEAQAFDAQFEAKEKKVQPSQEEFYIYSHSVVAK